MKRNYKSAINPFLCSAQCRENGYETLESIVTWIDSLNRNLIVNITPNKLSDSEFWFYDGSEIRNQNNSFFQIRGLEVTADGGCHTQPILIQDEIGYLGILCRELDGVLHFLMQAKIEPGNINKIQISPTIQATKSNFTQKHGGAKPKYLDYFLDSEKYHVIVDQIQSEQSSRFYKKRNRNILIQVDEDVEVLPNYKWMTLGQIKELLKIDNLVNMDTRTVLSCIPYAMMSPSDDTLSLFRDSSMYQSIFNSDNLLPNIYGQINDIKMFSNQSQRFIPLDQMAGWEFSDNGISHQSTYPFSVIFCDIEIEGREVRRWTQPLFKAEGIATFGLLTAVHEGRRWFLVRLTQEVGCHDLIELGPTVQLEATETLGGDIISDRFADCYHSKKGTLCDVLLSEEGGRFYHEQNRNIILETEYFHCVPKGYCWADYKTLNLLTQVNNCLNIQLRNLLSLLEV